MGGLVDILGGAAISASVVMGAADALEQSETVDGAFSALNEIVKNPFSEQWVYGVDSSVGEIDSRRPVALGEEVYESVVSLNGTCTGTIVTLDGYEAQAGGTLVVTAAHCIEGDAESAITIYGSALNNEGGLERFQMEADQVWVHPFHGDFNRNVDPGTINSSADIAFIYFDEETPPLVTPAEFVPIDIDNRAMEAAAEISASGLSLAELKEKYGDEIEELAYTTAGFSGDVIGLYTHEGALIRRLNDSQVLATDADGAQGTSGGPNYHIESDGTITLNDEGQPVVFAVNSAIEIVEEGDAPAEESYITLLKPEFLETVPFLEPAEEVCEAGSGIINNPNGANIRYGAEEFVFETLRPDINGPSAVPWGIEVDILARTENYLQEPWALVAGPNGRIGYVRADLIDFDTPDCETPAVSTPSVSIPTP